MRIGIIAIQHESNTFLSRPATLEDFERDVMLSGEVIREKFSAAHHEIGGFFEGLRENELEAVPLFAARAVPAGRISSSAGDALVSAALEALSRAGKLDGLLVAPHGAAVSENNPDFDGYWLSRVRETVGTAMPIVCTLDPHANLSQRMIDACNATVAYRTNPHLDQRERGIEAGNLLARHLRGEVKLTQALAMPRVAINIERQLTEDEPCASFYALADQQLKAAGVLSNSIVLGFPYADVEEMGSATIVVTDANATLAQACADELAQYVINHRDSFVGEIISVNQAIDRAQKVPKPVCLLDTGDNVGGGAPGDGTVLAQGFHDRSIPRAFAMILDPQSVAKCTEAGAGATLTLDIGGKTDSLHGSPLRLTVRVKSFHGGHYKETQVRHGGWTEGNMGQCAVVETQTGLTLLLTSLRTPPFSMQTVRSTGLDPATFDYLIAKGVHAPVAAYREVCRTFIRVNTPGVTNIDMTQLPFHHRRRPLFPFER